MYETVAFLLMFTITVSSAITHPQVTPSMIPESPYQRDTPCHSPKPMPRFSLNSCPSPDGEDAVDLVSAHLTASRVWICPNLANVWLITSTGLELSVQRGEPVVPSAAPHHRSGGRWLRHRAGAGQDSLVSSFLLCSQVEVLMKWFNVDFFFLFFFFFKLFIYLE